MIWKREKQIIDKGIETPPSENFIQFAGADIYIPFIKTKLNNPGMHDVEHEYVRDGVEYKINSYGYRSEEFQDNVDLLTLGCSNTWGLGIPKEFTWAEILKGEDIKTVNSIASCGDSAQGQVIKFFEYVKLFGNPKNVVAVLPVYRVEFPLENGKWEIHDKQKTYTLVNDNKASVVLSAPHDEDFTRYASAPYDPNYLLSKSFARYYTHTFINILAAYCKNFGINFRYSIYDRDYLVFEDDDYENSLLEYMLNNDENYFSFFYPHQRHFISDNEKKMDCHLEHKDNDYFYRANDFIDGKNMGHWGLHQNLHIAEAVRKSLF